MHEKCQACLQGPPTKGRLPKAVTKFKNLNFPEAAYRTVLKLRSRAEKSVSDIAATSTHRRGGKSQHKDGWKLKKMNKAVKVPWRA